MHAERLDIGPCMRLLCATFANQIYTALRNSQRVEIGQRELLRSGDVIDGGVVVAEAIVPWRAGGQHFEQHAPDRPDVCLAIVRTAARNLRRHEDCRSDRATALAKPTRTPKVGQFDQPCVVYKYVRAFQVAMHDGLRVKIRDCVQKLPNVKPTERLYKRSKHLKELSDRAARGILHHDFRRIVVPMHTKETDDMWVAAMPHEIDFALGSLT